MKKLSNIDPSDLLSKGSLLQTRIHDLINDSSAFTLINSNINRIGNFDRSLFEKFTYNFLVKSEIDIDFADAILRAIEIRKSDILKVYFCTNFRNDFVLLVYFLLVVSIVTKDVRYINSSLKLLDYLASFSFRHNFVFFLNVRSNLEKSLNSLFDFFCSENKKLVVKLNSNTFGISELSNLLPLSRPISVCVLSPNSRSTEAITLCDLLLSNNFNVSLIVSRKIFTISRFISEYKRDGPRWLLKKFISKFLNLSFDRRKTSNFSCALAPSTKNLRQWSLSRCSYLLADNFNDEDIISSILNSNVDLVIFTGGGILSSNFLESLAVPVVNCHGGILPFYRGLDLDVWPRFFTANNCYGFTTHLMESGIDTGNILHSMHFLPADYSSFKELFSHMSGLKIPFFVKSLISAVNNDFSGYPQSSSDGRQFYYMHRFLRRYLGV